MRFAVSFLLFVPGLALAQGLSVRELKLLPREALERPALEATQLERAFARGLAIKPTSDAPTLSADENGWFRDEALFDNYALATLQLDRAGTWILEAMGYGTVLVNGEPRVGNRYGYKDEWESWEPKSNFTFVPVALVAGENRFLFFGNRHGVLKATFAAPRADLQFNLRDVTLPDFVLGQVVDSWAALTVLNTTPTVVSDARLRISWPGGDHVLVELPTLAPLSVRKVAFPLRGTAPGETGRLALQLELLRADEVLDRGELSIEAKAADVNRRVTFRSGIDGSVQYYGYLPARGSREPKALVLSLHGASVEAINQSGSYAQLGWGEIVAPTNRRPFGFSWEDWGRLDALEVLQLARERYAIDPDRIYLTGHSMGGHGTWHLGALYPDRFAALAPSAGWISIWSYRQSPPPSAPTLLEALVERMTLPSQTLEMTPNLEGLGIFVLHGASDDNVPPEQSHLILERLRPFHRDLVYEEIPDVGHWWDLSNAPGADCVSWTPMFDFLAHHRRPASSELRSLRFRTANPEISAWHHWAGIIQQRQQFTMSSFELRFEPNARWLEGTTENVRTLGLDLGFARLDSLQLDLDGERLSLAIPADGRLWLRREATWSQLESFPSAEKGPHRAGGFRAAFRHRTQLVYATGGSPEHNAWALAKARYDAEFLWYQGNASIDVVADVDFDPMAEPDRDVVLYGNSETHQDWVQLWSGPLQVREGAVQVGDTRVDAADLGVLAVRPRPGGETSVVGIVAASGMNGARLLTLRPAFDLGVSYPDFVLFQDRGGPELTRVAGFFGNDWSLERGELLWADEARR